MENKKNIKTEGLKGKGDAPQELDFLKKDILSERLLASREMEKRAAENINGIQEERISLYKEALYELLKEKEKEIQHMSSEEFSKVYLKKEEDIKTSGDLAKILFSSAEISVNGLNEDECYLIEMIAKTGVSTVEEVMDIVIRENKHSNVPKEINWIRNNMISMLEQLESKGFVESEKVDINSKSIYNFSAFELTKKAEAFLHSINKKIEKTSKKATMKDKYGDINYGYFLEQSNRLFESRGYEVLENKDSHIYDLIIQKDENQGKVIVDFNEENDEVIMERLNNFYDENAKGNRKVSFYFLSSNDKQLISKTRRVIFLWMKERFGGFKAVKGEIDFHFTTYDRLQNKHAKVWDTLVI